MAHAQLREGKLYGLDRLTASTKINDRALRILFPFMRKRGQAGTKIQEERKIVPVPRDSRRTKRIM